MKNIVQLILITLLSVQVVFGQQNLKQDFKLNKINSVYLSEEPGLRSNIINCIALQGDMTTWIGTGQGISVMHDSLAIFTLDTLHLVEDEPSFLFDSIASMAVQDDVLAFS